MWFFLPTWHNNERALFIKIVSVSLVIHSLFFIMLFLSDAFSGVQPLVMGGAARVSVGSGSGKAPKGLASGSQVPSGQKQAGASQAEKTHPAAGDSQKVNTPKVEPVQKHAAKNELPKEPVVQKTQPAKKEAMQLQSAKVEPLFSPLVRKEAQKVEKAQKSEKVPKKASTPLFSELKKKYTSLKRDDKQDPLEKTSQSKVNEKAPEDVVAKKKNSAKTAGKDS